MEIEFAIYAGNKISKQWLTTIVDKNVFRLETTYDMYAEKIGRSIETGTYMLFDCPKNKIFRYRIKDELLLREYSLERWGRWSTLEREYQYDIVSKTTYLGNEALMVSKSVRDKKLYSNVSYELELIDSTLLRGFIDKEYIKYLIFSLYRNEGLVIESSDLLGRNTCLFANDRMITAAITKISES